MGAYRYLWELSSWGTVSYETLDRVAAQEMPLGAVGEVLEDEAHQARDHPPEPSDSNDRTGTNLLRPTEPRHFDQVLNTPSSRERSTADKTQVNRTGRNATELMRACTPDSGAAERRGREPNSDANPANTPPGDNAGTQSNLPAGPGVTIRGNRWSPRDVETLMNLFTRYNGIKTRSALVYAEWEILRLTGQLENTIYRSKGALNKIFDRYKNTELPVDANVDPDNVAIGQGQVVQQEPRNEEQAAEQLQEPPPYATNQPNIEEPADERRLARRDNSESRSQEDETEVSLEHLTEKTRSLRNQVFDTARAEFLRACKAESMVLPPLKKPQKPIPLEYRLMGDSLIRDLLNLNKDRISLEKLTCAVYAVGKVTLNAMRSKESTHSENAQKSQRDRVATRKHLSKSLAWIQEEILRRAQHTKLTERLKRQLNWLRKDYAGLQRLCDFRKLREKLISRLRITDKQIAMRLEEEQRRRVRKLPLRQALQKTAHAEPNKTIPISRVRDYWAGIIGKSKRFERSPELIEWRTSLPPAEAPIDLGAAAEAWEKVCKKAKSWKAPGPDGIPSGLWKAYPFAQEMLLKQVSKLIRGERPIPHWFARGRAILLYKKGDKLDPSNYRTICCLNTSYKLATALTTHWLRERLEAIGAIPQEQLAMRTGKWACCEAHFLDSTATSDAIRSARKRRQNSEVLSMAWIDFAKAFDSIPHCYVRWVLKSVGLDERLRLFIRRLMNEWCIQYEQYSGPVCHKSKMLPVRNGVLQGDTLSPLLYCICIAPISHWLNRVIPKYVSAFNSRGENRNPLEIGHLYYIDDLKIYTPRQDDLARAIEGVIRISGSMGLKVNTDKCGKVCITAPMGKEHPLAEELTRGALDTIPLIGSTETYRYLGLEQNVVTCQSNIWERVRKTILTRTAEIFSSRLSIRQMVSGYNVTIPAIVRFIGSCSVIGRGSLKSQRFRMSELDKEVRKILYQCGARFKSQSTYRVYASSVDGGLGLKRISDAYEESVVYAMCYLSCSPDLKTTHKFLRSLTTERNVIRDFEQICEEYGISTRGNELQINSVPGRLGITVEGEELLSATKAARLIVNRFKAVRKNRELGNLGRTRPGDRARPGYQMAAMVTDYARWGLDQHHAWRWLIKGAVGPKVTRNILVAQDNLLLAGYQRGLRRRCRFQCKQHQSPEESVAHIVSGCGHWASDLYTERHNMVANDIFLKICKKHNLETGKYQSRVSQVLENDQAKLYWNYGVTAAVAVKHNQPDLVYFLKDKDRPGRFQQIWIIEVAVAWYQGLQEKERQKYHRYAINSQTDSQHTDVNLQCELGKQFNCRVRTVPIVIGVFGEVSTNLSGYLEQLELECNTDVLVERLQRSAVIGTHWVIKAHLSVPPAAAAQR